MKKELITKLEEAIKEILSKYNEVHVDYDRREKHKLNINFTVSKPNVGWKRVGIINVFPKKCYKMLTVFDDGVLVLREEVSQLSTKAIVRKVIEIAKIMGMEVSFSTGDWERENMCSLILIKSKEEVS
jgi:hypothetical protein